MTTLSRSSRIADSLLSYVTDPAQRTRLMINVLLYSVLLIGSVVVCLPLIWMIVSSLKAPNRLFTIPIDWIPYEMRVQNYVEAMEFAPFGRYLLNSLFVSSAATMLNLFFCSLTGYAFAKYNFPGRNLFFMLILATLMIPFHVVVVPLFTLIRDLKWLNTYTALIVPGAMSAFGIFFMRQFISSIPDELFDAARMDGAGEFSTYVNIVVPLSTGPLSALAVFVFLDNWNSLLWPLVTTTNQEMRTLAVGLTQFQNQYGTKYHLMMAASTVVIVPMLIVFFMLQRHFIRGVALSGIKG